MQKLAGWMPTAIRGEQLPGDLALCLAVRELEDDSFLFALCQDHKLRMWSLRVSVSPPPLPEPAGQPCWLSSPSSSPHRSCRA